MPVAAEASPMDKLTMLSEHIVTSVGPCLSDYVKQLRSTATHSASVRPVAAPAQNDGAGPLATVRVVTPSSIQYVNVLTKASEAGSAYYYSLHQPNTTHGLPTEVQLQLPAEKVQLLQQQKLDHDKYVQVLHDYNDQKDVVVQLLGQLAAAENTTVSELYGRFGLEVED